MKNHTKMPYIVTLFSGLLFLQVTACSSMPWNSESGKDIATSGPTVLNAHTEPGTFSLNQQLKPNETNKVVADVKDFGSKVTDVKINFTEVPLSIPMKNVGGSTWVAELNAEQLKRLAVSGKTMKYEARVEAKDESGKISTSKGPVEISVQTPEVTKSG
ncbi:hypothetical protein WDW37_10375 [Bdellovibrionota bacterium FG-1]